MNILQLPIKSILVLAIVFVLSLPMSIQAYELTNQDEQFVETATSRLIQLIDTNDTLNTRVVDYLIGQERSKRDLSARTEAVLDELLIRISIKPYSVEAFKRLDFRGSELRIDAIENQTTAYTRYRISYLSNGVRVSGIMNIPSGAGPHPLVILNHGYIDPAVYTVGRGLKREQDYLARSGYTVLHTDYRNHGLSDRDPELDANYLFRNYFYSQDALNAILAVQDAIDNATHSELSTTDPDRVGMLGHSMGGGVTMHAMIARPDLINAGVLYAPVHSTERYNFDRRRREDLTSTQKNEREARLGALEVEQFMPYSATPYVSSISAPLQIYFGTADASVPYQRGVEIQEIFDSAGLNSELITYPGERHEFGPQWNSFMEGVVTFLDQTL